MTNNLEQALTEQKQQTEQVNEPIYGILGIPLGGQRLVEVLNRNSYVYVRLRNNQSETIQAFNNKVAPAYNLPVIVERQGNRYVVVSVDTQRYENNWNSFAPFLPRHGNTHSFDTESGGGGDIVWVYPRQFIPSMVMPSGSLGAGNVFVNAYQLQSPSGTWKYTGNTGSPNITSYRPTSSTGAIMGLVYLDTVSGNPYLIINSGTVFSNSITGSSQIAPYIPTVTNPATQIPLAAIRLITGTNILSWDNIYDIRQFLQTIPTGTGGGSSLTIQDEGVAQGTATTLNFVGDNVQATVAGGTARIFVTGSAGGGSINTGTLDARYLKLDTSNDPLTGQLNIQVRPSIDYGLYIDASGTTGAEFLIGTSWMSMLNGTVNFQNHYHDFSNNLFAIDPSQQILRMGLDNFAGLFRGFVYDILDISGTYRYYGGTIQHYIDSRLLLSLNPYATGSIRPYFYDMYYAPPTGTIHTQWAVQGQERARLDVSGTFYSNNVPLIKEAPIDGTSYSRKNAGWVASSGGLTISTQALTGSGTFTGAVNTFYDFDISGLSGDKHFTFPSGTAGDEIWVKTSTGDDLYELILEPATSVTLEGGSSEWSRLFISKEIVKAKLTAAGTWKITEDGRIPCSAKLDRITTNANTTHAANTKITVDWNNILIDNASIADTTNDRFNIRRAGEYRVSFAYRPANGVTDQNYISIILNGGAAAATEFGYAVNRASVSASSAINCSIYNDPVICVVDDKINAQFATQEANIGMLRNDAGDQATGCCWLSIIEIIKG